MNEGGGNGEANEQLSTGGQKPQSSLQCPRPKVTLKVDD